MRAFFMILSIVAAILLFFSSFFFFNPRFGFDSPLYPLFGFILLFAALGSFIIFLIILSSDPGKKSMDGWLGSARFANQHELQEFMLPPHQKLPPGSFFLSQTQTGIVAVPQKYAIQHGLVLGGSGRGKTRGYFMPNLALSNQTSFALTDVKSELWRTCSGYLNSARYAPTEPDESECFNWIPLCDNERMAQICARAIMESGEEITGNNAFYIKAETIYLTALFAHTATLSVPTPLTAFRLLTELSQDDLMRQLLSSQSTIARRQANIFLQSDTRVKGNIIPGVYTKLEWLNDPAVARFTSSKLTPPGFGKLRLSPQALFYCLHDHDMKRLQPLTSLFYTLLLDQIAGSQIPEKTQIPIMLLLEEFANSGNIPDFQKTITLARSRGVSIWMCLQSISQLTEMFGEHASRTILSSVGTTIALHGMDIYNAEYVSKMLGDTTVVIPKTSITPDGLISEKITYSSAEHKRPLMTTDEVTRLPEDQAIVRVLNRYPMRLWKIYFDTPPIKRSLLSLPPAQSITQQLSSTQPQPILVSQSSSKSNKQKNPSSDSILDIDLPELPS